MGIEFASERGLIQARRRRGIILKLVRQGHENQFSRMDDFEVWAMLQKLGQTVGRDQVVTLLQDLQVLDYIDFKSQTNEITGRVELSMIQLTATGLRFVTAGRSNDDVLFA
jgi:predicted ArsR family transcriptional regulator